MAVGATLEASSTSHQTRDSMQAAAMNSDALHDEQTGASHEVAEGNIITLGQHCSNGSSSLSKGRSNTSNADNNSLESSSCDKNTQHSDAAAGTSQWPALVNEQTELRSAQQDPHGASSSPSPPDNQLADAMETHQSVIVMNATERPIEAGRHKLVDESLASGSPTAEVRDRSGECQFKQPIAKTSTSSAVTEIDETKVGAQMGQQSRRVPQRKTSVFSFDGLSKLDQQALRRHSLLMDHSVGQAKTDDESKLKNQETMITSNQQQQQLQFNQQAQEAQHPQQVMIGGTVKSGDLVADKVGGVASSPRRSARSDTLGSTGSSRASSCDEPTIISSSTPASCVQQKTNHGDVGATTKTMVSRHLSPTESSTSSLDSIESDGPLEATSSVAKPCEQQEIKTTLNEKLTDTSSDNANTSLQNDPTPVPRSESTVAMEVDRFQTKEELSSSDDSNSSSDDVFQEESEVSALQSRKGEATNAPMFESIKEKIKRNSVPDAKTISQHIDRLIIQNEAIMENWNQVSIRSYNSQATTSAHATTSSSAGSCLPLSKNINKSSNTIDEQKNSSDAAQAAKRAIGQRWSTTALQSGQQPCLQLLTSPQASASPADHGPEDLNVSPNSSNQLSVGTRLRKRSYNNTIKRHPARQSSDASALNTLLLSSSLFSQGISADSAPSSMQFPFQLARNSNSRVMEPSESLTKSRGSPQTYVGAKNVRDNLTHSDAKHILANQDAELLLRQTHLNQTVENAIKNLSLKRQDERHMIQQPEELMVNMAGSLHQPQPQPPQPSDIVIASLLAERQRQQKLLEDYIHQQQLLLTDNQGAGIPAANILNHYQLQRQQQQLALDYQISLSEYHQQLNERILATTIQQQRQLPLEQLSERHSRESQMLNEFLAKMILDRSEHNQELTSRHEPSPIVGHGNFNGQKPSEMFTQPLDSATPSHRCDACDISFWTRDLLNYHLMTSCSARTGPEPAKPLAFKFNQPNGFDQLSSPALQHRQVFDRNLLMPPDLQFGAHAPLPSDHNARAGETIDFSKSGRDQRSHVDTFQPQRAHQTKSASPPRRRTYNEMQAPDLGSLEIPARYQTQQEQHSKAAAETTTTTTTSSMHTSLRSIYDKQPLVAPRSPHKSNESAERAWQQRLEELSAFKQQLSTTMKPTNSSNEIQGSNLPIKKRKISEPNMRY